MDLEYTYILILMTMKIIVETLYSKIYGDYPFKVLDEETSWFVDGYWNTDAFKRGWWDGKKHLLAKTKYGVSFPTGLLSLITKKLAVEGFDYEVEDHQNKEVIDPILPRLDGIDIEEWKPGGVREYQARCICDAIQAKRGVIWLPTNAGKTEVLIGITAVIKKRTGFLVHTLTLLNQTRERFRTRLRRGIGIIGGGMWNPQDITIATIQTLNARRKSPEVIEWKESLEVLIIDECHHSSADSFHRFAMSCPASIRFGSSATAFTGGKGSEMMLRAATGPLITKMEQSELVRVGISAKPIIHILEVNRPLIYKRDWAEIEQEGIVENNYRNMLICKLAAKFYKQELPCLILVEKILHGRIISDLLHEELCTTKLHQFIWGDTPEFARQEAEKRFREGDLPILITSRIFSEGVDIPKISALIITPGGLSKTAAIQRVGRGLRQNELGKVQIIDFRDRTHKILERHSRSRIQTYRDEEAYTVEEIKTSEIPNFLAKGE